MEYRYFESLKRPTSLMGMGCMRLPMKDNEIDYDEATAMVDYAIQSGVNYFDTAYFYHRGESERFIAQALKKYPRDSYMLVTKMPIINCKSYDDVVRIFNDQLEKCQVDYFDTYLIHSLERKRLDKFIDYKCYEFLSEQKEAGKIKRLGFSFHDTPEILEKILNMHEWDVVQIQLNYLDWKVQRAEASYNMLKERNIPCTIMEPNRGGFLANLPDHCAHFMKEANSEASQASWALRWVASLPNVAVVLNGASNLAQLKDSLSAFKEFKPLSESEHQVINNVRDAILRMNAIGCTGCRYCEKCPKHIDIPRMFSLYNRYKYYDEEFRVKYEYAQMESEHKGFNCVGCGLCMKECPQHLEIPKLLKQVNELFSTFEESPVAVYPGS